MPRSIPRVAVCLAAMLALAAPAASYSVLTHEEVVDVAWDDDIRPLLQARFGALAEPQLRECHAYAYGGAVIQDLGYYPFGSKDFSDLVHYVRSGDFVAALLANAQDANEYCFALGALAHYVSDVNGHPAVNASVAELYPKLRSRFGRSVTYFENRAAHLKTEFGFDVAQVAKQRYASEQYRNFIGFEVSKPLLERVFPQVYGLELKSVLTHEDLAIGSYRWAVSGMIPKMTKVAWQTHKDEIVRDRPDLAEREYLYHLSRAAYEKEWGREYQRPGVGTRFLAFLLRLLPRIGPLRALALKPPTQHTEDLYLKSVDATIAEYKQHLHELRNGVPALPNRDLDTSNPTRFGEYPLTDQSYRTLAVALAKHDFQGVTPQLRANILSFYAGAPAGALSQKENRELNEALDRLKQTPAAAAGSGSAP